MLFLPTCFQSRLLQKSCMWERVKSSKKLNTNQHHGDSMWNLKSAYNAKDVTFQETRSKFSQEAMSLDVIVTSVFRLEGILGVITAVYSDVCVIGFYPRVLN